MAASIDGPFVVFLIGARINRPLRPQVWLPTLLAMRRVLSELDKAPADTGFLGHTGLSLRLIVQYWRSFDHLEAYARDRDQAHWPAWAAFNRRVKAGRDAVGIWHETYLVAAGQYEAVYSGMPPFGLGQAGRLVPAIANRFVARDRLQSSTTALGTPPTLQ